MTRGLYQYGRNKFFRLVAGIARSAWLQPLQSAPGYISQANYINIPGASRLAFPPSFTDNPANSATVGARFRYCEKELNGTTFRIIAKSAVTQAADGGFSWSQSSSGDRHAFEYETGREFGASAYFLLLPSSVSFLSQTVSVGDNQVIAPLDDPSVVKVAIFVRKDSGGYGGNYLMLVSRRISDPQAVSLSAATRTPRGLQLFEVYQATAGGLSLVDSRVIFAAESTSLPVQVCLVKHGGESRCVITLSPLADSTARDYLGQVFGHIHQDSIEFPYSPDSVDSRLIGYSSSFFSPSPQCFAGIIDQESEDDDRYVKRMEIEHSSTVRTVFFAGLAGFPTTGLDDWGYSQPLSRLASPRYLGGGGEAIDSGDSPTEEQSTASPLYDFDPASKFAPAFARGPSEVRAVCLAANESWLSSISGNLAGLSLPKRMTVLGREISGVRLRFETSGRVQSYATPAGVYFGGATQQPMPAGLLSRQQLLKIGADMALIQPLSNFNEYFFQTTNLADKPLSGNYDVVDFEIYGGESSAGIFRMKWDEGPFEFNYSGVEQSGDVTVLNEVSAVVEASGEIWCFLGLAMQEDGAYVYDPNVNAVYDSPDQPKGKIAGVAFEAGSGAAAPSIVANAQVRRSAKVTWQRRRTTTFANQTVVVVNDGPETYEDTVFPDYVASIVCNRQQTAALCVGEEVVPTTWFLEDVEPYLSPGESAFAPSNLFSHTMKVSLI